MKEEVVAEMMRVVVATDGSPHAIGAAKFTARLVRELRESEVVLVHVGHIPAMAMGGLGEGYIDFAALEEGMKQAGEAILSETAKAFAGIDGRVSCVYQGAQRRYHRHGEPGHGADRRPDPRERERKGAARGAWPRLDRAIRDTDHL